MQETHPGLRRHEDFRKRSAGRGYRSIGHHHPPNLPGWDDVPVVEYLSVKLRMSARMLNDAITAKDVAEAAFDGDEEAREIFAESGRYFGRGLAVLIDILNPEMIVAGSIYARSHVLMDRYIEEELKKEALKFNAESCKIEAARLGEQIGDYGTVMAAVYE